MGALGGQSVLRWALRLAAVPLFAVYGVFTLIAESVSLIGWTRRLARLLGRTLPCPSCGSAADLHGRWHCRACGATYHGFVGACALCGSSASFFPCRACGASIPLGGGR